MRILAAGDFHGKTPRYLKKIIKKYRPNLLLCPGDFCLGTFFNAPKSMRTFMKQAYKKGVSILKFLNSLNLPVLLIFGNHELFYQEYISHEKIKSPRFLTEIGRMKNITYMHNKKLRLDGFNFIGSSKYREGRFRADLLNKVRDSRHRKMILKSKKMYRKYYSWLMKGEKNVIFLSHDVPYNTRLDKIKNRQSPINGKHFGDDILRWAVEKYKPYILFCGHMHENLGFQKIGKTLVVNSGYGMKGQAVFVELSGKKINIKLLRCRDR